MKKASEKKKKAIMDKVMGLMNKEPSKTDPLGSYTGMPVNPHEVPVQDEDDL